MGVIVFSNRPNGLVYSPVNPNHLNYVKLLPKSNKPNNLRFHYRPLRTKQLRCLSASESASNSDPDTPRDEEVENLGVKAALAMLRFYKREISPVIPRSCRYVPTCSEYSMEAYRKYGVLKGTILTAWRLCRCNPLGGSGFDPPRWFSETKPLVQEEDEDNNQGAIKQNIDSNTKSDDNNL